MVIEPEGTTAGVHARYAGEAEFVATHVATVAGSEVECRTRPRDCRQASPPRRRC